MGVCGLICPNSVRFRNSGHRLKGNPLVHWTNSGDLSDKRQATWGMSRQENEEQEYG